MAQGEPWFTEGGSSRESKEVQEDEIGGQEKGATGGKGGGLHTFSSFLSVTSSDVSPCYIGRPHLQTEAVGESPRGGQGEEGH